MNGTKLILGLLLISVTGHSCFPTSCIITSASYFHIMFSVSKRYRYGLHMCVLSHNRVCEQEYYRNLDTYAPHVSRQCFVLSQTNSQKRLPLK